MDCRGARRLLLEADLSELTPHADSDLGAHLRACASCRGAADEILGAEAGLAASLAAATPRGDDAVAVARAAALARRRAGRRRVGAAVSLAAAAVLAGLLVLPPRRNPTGVAPASLPDVAAGGFSVVAPPGRTVMVLQPANPNIVVVWYLSNRRSS